MSSSRASPNSSRNPSRGAYTKQGGGDRQCQQGSFPLTLPVELRALGQIILQQLSPGGFGDPAHVRPPPVRVPVIFQEEICRGDAWLPATGEVEIHIGDIIADKVDLA